MPHKRFGDLPAAQTLWRAPNNKPAALPRITGLFQSAGTSNARTDLRCFNLTRGDGAEDVEAEARMRNGINDRIMGHLMLELDRLQRGRDRITDLPWCCSCYAISQDCWINTEMLSIGGSR